MARVLTASELRLLTPAQKVELGICDPTLVRDESAVEKIADKAERVLQGQCENWMTLNGFRRRTPEEICRPGMFAGWFIHLHEAKRNPILLDLLILFNDGRYIEVELKSATGNTTPAQEALVDRGGKLCRTLAEFISVMQENIL